jgi:hypothetical protein
MIIQFRSALLCLTCFLLLLAIHFDGRGQVPFPPESVYAQMLGPDSAMYVSWQEPDSSGLVIEAYNIYRISDFDPEGDPGEGEQTWILSHNWPACGDPEWAGLEYGWYAYGVTASYTNGMVSEMAVSNIVGHDLYCNLSVSVNLESGQSAVNAHAAAYGSDYSYQEYFGKDSIIVPLDSVMKGHYLVAAYHTGFDTNYLENVLINSDTFLEVTLGLRKRPVYDLYVDSVSLIATWSEPGLVAVYEDFEGEQFPPPGWQLSSADEYGEWFRTIDGSSGGFAIPPGDAYYACDNVDMHGSDPHNSCCDYLITPPLDLTESEDYMLDFSSYYTGAYGQLAFIEYSMDRGENWEVMMQLDPASGWNTIQMIIAAISGEDAENPLWIAFHADWNGSWASGWAVDNVKIYVPGSQVEYTDFNIFLDDSLISNTTDTTWNYAPLNYGQHYIAAVSVNYRYGTSKKDYYPFTSRYLPPPLDFTAQADVSEVILQWNPPSEDLNKSETGMKAIPGNLLGYNIYKDDVFLAYLAHSGEDEPQVYVDSNNIPGFYSYYISGIYDLEIYGLPGDTGESMKTPPVNITVDYCTEIPFSENWDSGFFTGNNWLVQGPGWMVNENEGNEVPSACFSPDTLLQDYSSALMSYPFCGIGFTEGRIWLDFDLQLSSNGSSGTETIKVQIWDWINREWKTLAMFTNKQGNFQWTAEHINLSRYALNKVFRIRFMTAGVQFTDSDSWCIDNISIYRECVEPANLSASLDPENAAIVLTWAPPVINVVDEWIRWDNGEYCSGTALTAYDEIAIAARWDPAQLTGLAGACITEVAFFLTTTDRDYKLRVWQGAVADSLIVDQPFDSIQSYEWNTVLLDAPVFINPTTDLWIGYHVVQNSTCWLQHDCEPAIDGYGNMIFTNGWHTFKQLTGYEGNWNISAHIMSPDGKKRTLSIPGNNHQENSPGNVAGYNIFRRTGSDDYSQIAFTPDTTYTDTNLTNEMYCYKVSAVWSGETDECESQTTDEVCEILNVGITDPGSSMAIIDLYPNPANEQVIINSSAELLHISIYDSRGKMIINEQSHGQKHILFTSGFPSGLYIVRIETDSGLTFRKLVVGH